MSLNSTLSPTLLPAWAALTREAAALHRTQLRDLFAADPQRVALLTRCCGDLMLDFSKQRITGKTLELLHGLARESGLAQQIARLFAGE